MDSNRNIDPITPPPPVPEPLRKGFPVDDPSSRKTVTLIVLVSVFTVLTGAVAFVAVFGRGQSAGVALASILPLMGLTVNQLIIALRSETTRNELRSQISKTRHDIKGDLNYGSLLAQAKDREDVQSLIRTVADEVRVAEREQFWSDPANRVQLREVFKEVTEECREDNRLAIVQALREYHKTYHGDAGPRERRDD
jgi:hypothetical protein